MTATLSRLRFLPPKMACLPIPDRWTSQPGWNAGAAIDALDRLFCAYGYYGFIPDIYGEVFTRRRERALKLAKEAERMRATADIMEAVA
jgi:hypothetical protein